MSARISLVGRVFGKLKVVSQSYLDGHAWAECLCECGNSKTILSASLTRGASKSCGCNKYGHRTTHGLCGTKTYRAWCKMIERCTNPNNAKYKDYGARGITICAQWLNSFEAFLTDMGIGPQGKSIDRIDNDGNYEPGNCQWRTPLQQARNKRNNKRITVIGITGCLSELAERFGVSAELAGERIRHGWEPEMAFFCRPNYFPRAD